MPHFGPVKRRDLISTLRRAGWTGPEPGSRHQYMSQGIRRITIPNPHEGDIGLGLLKQILTQAGISRQEWERL